MDLHRRRAFVFPVVLLVIGAALLFGPWIVGAIVILLGLAALAWRLRPFRFRIGSEGLDVRYRGLNRAIRWHEIDAMTDRSGQLLIAPAMTSDLLEGSTGSFPGDGRPARVLLNFIDVKEPADEIILALRKCGGPRFVDVQTAPGFTVVARGYDRGQVDAVIDRVNGAHDSGDQARIAEARSAAAAADFTVVLRGYDRAQVDAYLRTLP